jgi:glucose-1-phosphate thymidylyltransferase
VLILGDNIFQAAQDSDGPTVFAYRLHNPKRYGVVEFDDQGQAISLEENRKDCVHAVP